MQEFHVPTIFITNLFQSKVALVVGGKGKEFLEVGISVII